MRDLRVVSPVVEISTDLAEGGGNALADVLSGDVNPTARLPLTFPNVENEVNFSRAAYPGVNTISVYEEKLEVGYRWYGAHSVVPRWPFGHGLSYTRFAYSKLQASASAVSVDITNSGAVAGAEVPQLYLGFPESADSPAKQLKGFEKVQLAAGESATVTLTLDERTLRPGEAATLAGLLLQSADEEPLPDWKHEKSAFASALRAKAAGAAQVFDGSTRRLAPQVKADAALRAIHGHSVASMLLAVLVAVAAVSLMALLAEV